MLVDKFNTLCTVGMPLIGSCTTTVIGSTQKVSISIFIEWNGTNSSKTKSIQIHPWCVSIPIRVVVSSYFPSLSLHSTQAHTNTITNTSNERTI
mmetsp:Transcript_46607/g.51937  ORF Transcript_46607/g.51937 Transcript_46607/m.51937 type:complete len:94 (+) Transcript_46607:944-1225(+)